MRKQTITVASVKPFQVALPRGFYLDIALNVFDAISARATFSMDLQTPDSARISASGGSAGLAAFGHALASGVLHSAFRAVALGLVEWRGLKLCRTPACKEGPKFEVVIPLACPGTCPFSVSFGAFAKVFGVSAGVEVNLSLYKQEFKAMFRYALRKRVAKRGRRHPSMALPLYAASSRSSGACSYPWKEK